MKWISRLIWLAGAAFAAWNTKGILAATAPVGESFTADGVKYVGGPVAVSGALVALWSLIKRLAPVLFKGALDKWSASQGILPDAPKTAESTNVDATRIVLDKPNIDLTIVLTGDAAEDLVGLKKIGAVLEHYGSGGQSEA